MIVTELRGMTSHRSISFLFFNNYRRYVRSCENIFAPLIIIICSTHKPRAPLIIIICSTHHHHVLHSSSCAPRALQLVRWPLSGWWHLAMSAGAWGDISHFGSVLSKWLILVGHVWQTWQGDISHFGSILAKWLMARWVPCNRILARRHCARICAQGVAFASHATLCQLSKEGAGQIIGFGQWIARL